MTYSLIQLLIILYLRLNCYVLKKVLEAPRDSVGVPAFFPKFFSEKSDMNYEELDGFACCVVQFNYRLFCLVFSVWTVSTHCYCLRVKSDFWFDTILPEIC